MNPSDCVLCKHNFHYGTASWTEPGCLLVTFVLAATAAIGFGLANFLKQVANDKAH